MRDPTHPGESFTGFDGLASLTEMIALIKDKPVLETTFKRMPSRRLSHRKSQCSDEMFQASYSGLTSQSLAAVLMITTL